MSEKKHEYVKFHGESDPLILFVDGWLYEKLGESHEYWRIIDETNDDYLYDPDCFEVVKISDAEYKKEKAKQAKLKELWNEVSSLYYECEKIDDGISKYFDSNSVKMLEKKKKVLQAIIDGKKPKEIGQDYWNVLELKKK